MNGLIRGLVSLGQSKVLFQLTKQMTLFNRPIKWLISTGQIKYYSRIKDILDVCKGSLFHNHRVVLTVNGGVFFLNIDDLVIKRQANQMSM